MFVYMELTIEFWFNYRFAIPSGTGAWICSLCPFKVHGGSYLYDMEDMKLEISKLNGRQNALVYSSLLFFNLVLWEECFDFQLKNPSFKRYLPFYIMFVLVFMV